MRLEQMPRLRTGLRVPNSGKVTGNPSVAFRTHVIPSQLRNPVTVVAEVNKMRLFAFESGAYGVS